MCNCLEALRLERDITQAALARAMGLAPSTVCRYETGELQMSLASLRKAAAFLQVAPSAILPDLCTIMEDRTHAT